jgi:hypothetical protein
VSLSYSPWNFWLFASVVYFMTSLLRILKTDGT